MRGWGLLCAALCGCGLGPLGDEPGGDSNLPNLGAGPFEKLPLDRETPADEPYLVAERSADLTDPAVLEREDGGVRLWFTRKPEGEPEAIWYAELPAITALPDVAPGLALSAGADWEEGRVAAPALLDLGGGVLHLYYEGGVESPAIGLARSADGGGTWEKDPGNPILPGALRPSVAAGPRGIHLYAESPGGVALLHAHAEDGVSFGAPRELLLPGPPGAFDHLAISDPHVVARRTGAGRLHYALFYVGRSAGAEGEEIEAIGFAGSFDGRRFEKLGGSAVLAPELPSERGPAALIAPGSGRLFFSELRSGRQRIAVATYP